MLITYRPLRHMDVIRFVFSTDGNYMKQIRVAKFGLKIGPPLIWLWLWYGFGWEIHIACSRSHPSLFLSLCLIVFVVECAVANQIRRHNPNSFEHVSLWCLFFDPYLTTHIKCRHPVKRRNQMTHASL